MLRRKKMSAAKLSKIDRANKYLNCACGQPVRVGELCKKVVCYKCFLFTQAFMNTVPKFVSVQKKKSSFPRGWRFMKVFVANDGTVYHRGKEMPDLKGTLKPTNVEKIKEEQRIKREERKRKNKLKLEKLGRKRALIKLLEKHVASGNKKAATKIRKKIRNKEY